MPSKTASRKPRAPRKQAAKPQPTQKNQSHRVRAESLPLLVDKDHEALEAERADLQKPGRVSKSDAEQIDNDPGYDKDQLAHMREYWGLKESTATEAEHDLAEA